MGFGHAVYTARDPRVKYLKQVSRHLGIERGDTRLFDISAELEDRVTTAIGKHCNVDFYSASVQDALGIAGDMFTCVSRPVESSVVRPHPRAACRQQDHPSVRRIRGSDGPPLRADRESLTSRHAPGPLYVAEDFGSPDSVKACPISLRGSHVVTGADRHDDDRGHAIGQRGRDTGPDRLCGGHAHHAQRLVGQAVALPHAPFENPNPAGDRHDEGKELGNRDQQQLRPVIGGRVPALMANAQ